MIARVPLPDHLAPHDHRSGTAIALLVKDYLTWGPDQQAEILALIPALLPYQPETPRQIAPDHRFYARTGGRPGGHAAAVEPEPDPGRPRHRTRSPDWNPPVGAPDPEVGELAWECWRLSADQLAHLSQFAKSLT